MTKQQFLILFMLVASLSLFGGVQAQSDNIWTIDFYPNTTLTPPATMSYQSNFINFNWGSGSPGPGFPADNFSFRAVSDVYFNTGTYQFSVLADDEFRIWVNGVLVMSTWESGAPGKTFVSNVSLTQGVSKVEVDFREFTGLAYITVNWTQLKAPPPPQPPTTQPPPSATSVKTRYGDYTRCIQQNLHQAQCFQSDGAWNSPNLGSIQLEPRIVIWGNCTPGQRIKQVTIAGQPAKMTQCSKTEAGWFQSE